MLSDSNYIGTNITSYFHLKMYIPPDAIYNDLRGKI